MTASKIVDANGRPFTKKELKKSQTAEVSSLKRTFAEHPSKGLSIQKLPRILEAAEQGDLSAQASLFNDMQERDGHIFAEMQKRKNALLKLDWSIEPPKNSTAEEKALAAKVAQWFEALPDFEDIILNALDAIGHGFSAQEIEWEFYQNEWLPKAIIPRPQSWFRTTPGQKDTLLLNDGSLEGAPLWPFGWLVHQHNAKSGFIAESGLVRVLAWPYLFKNFALRDLAEFLEIYGLPARVGTYLQGATQEEKDTLLEALVMLGHDAAGIIPEGTTIDFQSAAEGQANNYQVMIDWCERTVSKVILGATLTSQADGKSSTNALGNVHNEVRHDLTVADARQLEGLFRQLIQMLCQLNGYQDFNSRRLPRLVFDVREIADLTTFAEGIAKLVEAGMETIPVSWVHKKLAIPEPKSNEPVLKRIAPLTPALLSQSPYRSFAALSHTQDGLIDPAQVALDNAPDIPDVINQAISKLLSPVIAALQQGQSPDEALDIIAASYPALDDGELIQILTQAQFVADIWGRLNASE
ncbi:DUF935 domain-containing protein [Limnobaculum xujianqingii]|uniref:DUF935 domain-containing protein n=1 Tax=Limnobaculum xujianqingii TaxID=2738837 RepID=UPI00112CB62C|nr:DUF935 domain-containing protein [Limnobaculum xujianqingii]